MREKTQSKPEHVKADQYKYEKKEKNAEMDEKKRQFKGKGKKVNVRVNNGPRHVFPE